MSSMSCHFVVPVSAASLTETHHDAFLAQRGEHPLLRTRGLADLEQHVHHFFVGAAV
jgi:hypothetical protein